MQACGVVPLGQPNNHSLQSLGVVAFSSHQPYGQKKKSKNNPQERMQFVCRRHLSLNGSIHPLGSSSGAAKAASSLLRSTLRSSVGCGQLASRARYSTGSLVVSATGEGLCTTVIAGANQQHKAVFDEPTAVGGTDKGLTPLEGMLGSLAACEAATAQVVAKKQHLHLGKLSFRIEGMYDLSAVAKYEPEKEGEKRPPPPPTHFQKVEQHVSVQMEAPTKDKFDRFRNALEELCPVTSLLRAAGVPLVTHWKVEALPPNAQP
ncbi:Osmotically inducible protein C [Balamuthia mandrillaris]